MLCLGILQAASVSVNTLMLHDAPAEPDWSELLTAEDRRGLTPLFWQHVLPDEQVKLEMSARPAIRTASSVDGSSEVAGRVRARSRRPARGKRRWRSAHESSPGGHYVEGPVSKIARS